MNRLAFAIIVLFMPIALCAQFLGDGTQRTHIAFPIGGLATVPPLNTGMNLDCLYGYIVADSSARSLTRAQVQNYFATVSLDTLKQIARRFYAVVDHDPKLFQRYLASTQDSLATAVVWKSYPANVYTSLNDALYRRLPSFGIPIMLLLTSDLVLRVKVRYVVTGVDSTFAPTQWVSVAAEVLDTIKGQTLPAECSSSTESQHSRASAPCILFGYRLGQATGIGGDGAPSGLIGSYGMVAPDDELYVFLDEVAVSKHSDILMPMRSLESNGGMFRIAGGSVVDSTQVFGLGTLPADSTFRSALQNHVTTIQTWTLP
jgi:hypothetical protein